MVDVGSAMRQRWAEQQAQRAAWPKIPSAELADRIGVGPTRELAKRNDLFGVPDERSLFDENTDDWKYIGQRAGRGVADLIGGIPDLGSATYNLGSSGFDWLTGLDTPKAGYLSDAIADKATELTGADIIPADAVQTSAQGLGAVSQLGIGAATGPETLIPLAASKGSSWLAKSLRALDPLERLPGAPSHIEGPVPHVVQAAEQYAKDRGIRLTRQSGYGTADPLRGQQIAQAYEDMPHDPTDPLVAKAYQALADETMSQWHALQDAGAKIEFIKPGDPDPYPGGPREALADLRANNHLFVFPTEQGFGSINEITDNPLLARTGITHDGHDMLVNDAFRAVHDYFGHGMEGANFGARGEENAWRAHSRLFSPEALPAVTSETRGQNSWVNFGPYGEANRANQKGTVFADQKTGVMPKWTTREGGMDPRYRMVQASDLAGMGGALGLLGYGAYRDGSR